MHMKLFLLLLMFVCLCTTIYSFIYTITYFRCASLPSYYVENESMDAHSLIEIYLLNIWLYSR